MATGTTTPPLLQGPTAKEKKYDRQLRLWAASGQQALENAHVLLLNVSPGVVGIETLKNLILPGIGSFTVVDEDLVTEKDLGVNFFLSDESLGRPRAAETCRLLRELNPEVQGYALHQPIEKFIESPQALEKYSLILLIASPKGYSKKVSDIAATNSIPLFYIHSIGFYSYFSVQLPEIFPIVNTHPDPVSTQDLRLLEPWPELVGFTEEKTDNLEKLSDHDHGHIPYLLLLLHYLSAWKSSHGGKPPADYKEKKEFKALVEKGARTSNAEGGEENYDEAAAAVLKSLNPPSLPSGLRDIFDHQECQNPNTKSSNFWIIANAISTFYSTHKSIPLPGSLPDMKAQSVDYIHLQNIYKTKARQDLHEVTSHVRQLEHRLGRANPIDAKEIEAFSKGAAFVKLIRGQRFCWTLNPHEQKQRLQPLSHELHNEDSLFPLAIVFQAYISAMESQSQSQATTSSSNEELTFALQRHSRELIETASSSSSTTDTENTTETKIDAIITEMQRAGGLEGGELHNISALTGGMVAQEAIKVITKQYIPIDNTCVFDGIGSRSKVFRI